MNTADLPLIQNPDTLWDVNAGAHCSSTPARRAFERPMAIACLCDRAPCLPSRTW